MQLSKNDAFELAKKTLIASGASEENCLLYTSDAADEP